jgi:hypothetical protein
VLRRALIAGALLAVAAAVAVPLALVATGDGGDEPTRSEYLAQVNAICHEYEQRLQEIPPPANPASPLIVKQSVARALPLVIERLERIRAVEPPRAMRAQVQTMLDTAEEATNALRQTLAAANAGNVARMARALGAFAALRDEARTRAEALGITC